MDHHETDIMEPEPTSQSLNLAPASCEDYRLLAARTLPRPLFDYVDGGAYQEYSLAENIKAFERCRLSQRVMRDVSEIKTDIQLFNEPLSMPLIMAPVGLAGMLAQRGEVQAAQAANRLDIPFCLSTVSICPLEEVATASAGNIWFQLYMMRDRAIVKELMARAQAAGCHTLVFTVDLAVVGARYRDLRNGLAGGLGPMAKARLVFDYLQHSTWLINVALKGRPLTFGNLSSFAPSANSMGDFKQWVDSQFDASCSWHDIEWLRDQWPGTLLIKGIMEPDDAKAAIRAGADGIIVSNHGGRQLDGVAASLSKLAAIRHALGPKAVILMDGGVRNGQDMIKAKASGADAVLAGRAWAYALAAKGSQGIETLFERWRAELKTSMALTGVTNFSDITPDVLDM